MFAGSYERLGFYYGVRGMYSLITFKPSLRPQGRRVGGPREHRHAHMSLRPFRCLPRKLRQQPPEHSDRRLPVAAHGLRACGAVTGVRARPQLQTRRQLITHRDAVDPQAGRTAIAATRRSTAACQTETGSNEQRTST